MSEDKPNKSKTAEREENTLKFWQDNKIFEKSLKKESPKGNFVFYDGPPFATGEPHYGHLLPGTIKDVIPRYKTMQGYLVRRTWGWDCHGLPIENLIEKELGLKSKKEIESYGVEKFNKSARDSVLRYDKIWKEFVPRSGRWVNMNNPYKTMDSSYTESVWWSFKTLFDKNLIYEGFKVMPYCPHCGTTISNFEVNLGYKDISDISVYVKFKIKLPPSSKLQAPSFFMAWTTTPWTLPGNTALAVGKDIEYVEARVKGEILVLAKEKLSVLGEEYEVVATHKGSEMVGMEYEPVFDNYVKDESLKNKENGWKVYCADFVNTEDGTGIVHIAPAFGGDDYELSKKENLPFIQHVDADGKMKAEMAPLNGLLVKPKSDDEKERLATDIEIIKYLQAKGNYFDKKKIVHSYPHCWRCDTPLLNYATSSWFVKVVDIKERLIELNKKINWVPSDIGEGRFGKWLEGARDWAISRSRFWGAPLPVWQTEKGEKIVLGSLGDLKDRVKKSGNKYFVMRHGESEKNESGIQNHDLKNVFHLTEKGKQMVVSKLDWLKENKIDLIISSPFPRCQETAMIVKEGLGLESIEIDDRLWELKRGTEYEGKTVEDYHIFFQSTRERFMKAPSGGETLTELGNRVGEFIYELEKKYQGKNILILSHEATVTALYSVLEGAGIERAVAMKESSKYRLDLAEVREIEFTPLPHNENYELDLHKPYIDQVELVNKNGEKLTRVNEVFDTWYDSGSMPFASVYYPFENKEEFDKKGNQFFPADFIAEGLDQTRGWFYTLLVLGAGLFDKSPYNNVAVTGIVLAEDGQKMSKRLKNYPDPNIILDKYGADSLRFYLLSSPVVHAEDLLFSEKGLDEVHKKIISRLENVLTFYQMYADKTIDNRNKTIESENVLDRWLISRLNELGEAVTKNLESYEFDKASRPFLDFIDDFSTWYIRRSRERFKSDDLEDRNSALGTTNYCLLTLSKYMAPFTPFFAEHIYQSLKIESDPESVHLCEWPHSAKATRGEPEVLEKMIEVRKIVSLALEKRNEAGIKIRQPLQKLRAKSLKLRDNKGYIELIRDELNVKNVELDENLEENVWLDTNITPELQKEGDVREFVRAVQELRKEKNLTPDKKVVLQVETLEDGKKFIEQNKETISKPTNISDFDFSPNDGKEVLIDKITLKIRIK